MHDPALTGLLNMDAEPVREFFRQAPVMMHTIDRSGRLVAVTSYWAARLGYLPEEMIGRRSVEFLSPASRRLAELEVMPRFFRQGEIQKQPYVFQRKDGTEISILLSAVTLRDADGQFDRALAFMIEDDGRDLLQRDLQAALLRAERANHAKAQFLTAMSHELRTPMNAILGFAQLLKLTDLTTKQTAHVEAILASGRQLMSRLSELMDLSQLEFADLQLSRAETGMDALLGPVLAAWRDPIEQRGLTLTDQIDTDVPDRFSVDVLRVQQVLNVFLSNALTRLQSGDVRIQVRSLANVGHVTRLEFSVQDSGPGLDPDRVEALLERSADSQADATLSGGGSEFGLSICRGIADAIGGEINIFSARGGGVTFSLTLDVIRATPGD